MRNYVISKSNKKLVRKPKSNTRQHKLNLSFNSFIVVVISFLFSQKNKNRKTKRNQNDCFDAKFNCSLRIFLVFQRLAYIRRINQIHRNKLKLHFKYEVAHKYSAYCVFKHFFFAFSCMCHLMTFSIVFRCKIEIYKFINS